MSYTVTLKDGRTYSLENEEAEVLKDHWINSDKPFPVEIQDDAMSSMEIRRITKNKSVPLHKLPVDGQKQLANGCRGINSINKEIMSISMGLGDPRLLKDKEWRAKMFAELRASDVVYCDAEKGTCGCPKPFANNATFML